MIFNTSHLSPSLHMKSTAITIAILGLLLSSSPAQNLAVPPYINYQSVVTDSTGTGLGDAAPINRKILFRIYDAPTAGAKVWAEEQTVTISKGEFSVLLGNGIPAPSPDDTLHGDLSTVFAGGDRYIGITVDNGDGTLNGSDAEITPRARITSTAFAFRAKTADSIASGSSLQLVGSSATGGLGYYDSATPFGGIAIGGPVLYGASGGALGSVNGATQTIALSWDASGIISGNGSGLTNLSANSLTGTVADARLSNNVALRAGGNTFNGDQVMSGLVKVGTAVTGITRGLEVTNGVVIRNNNAGGFEMSDWTEPALCLRRSDDNYTTNQISAMISLGFRDDPITNLGSDQTASINIIPGGANTTTTTAMDMRINSPGSMTLNSKQLNVVTVGNVGIGTTTPTQAKLVVNSSVTINPGTGYLSRNDTATRQFVAAGTPWAVSIWAQDGIAAAGFWAVSDERIKRIAARSDGSHDLATLCTIEVTDYSYIDTVSRGGRAQKKVIAQQVESVFPQAVSKSTDVVPDIYQKATFKDGWVELVTDLKKGDRVKLIGDNTQGIHEVLEVADGRFRTNFKQEGDRVFVYGREVNDFRTVDYDAIAMLNVSATQQLKKDQDAQIQVRDAKIAALEQRLAELEAKDKARDAQLAAIAKALSSGDRPAARSVSLKRETGAE